MNKFEFELNIPLLEWTETSSRQIHEAAQDITRYIKNNKNCQKVLKTDADNEGGISRETPIVNIFHPNNIDSIEVDESVINKARELHPDYNFILGNTQKIPFENEYYDVVLDFSTIDHQKDYKKTLDEYRRVLKPQGLLSVVVWTAKEDGCYRCHRPEHERQYLFAWDTFRDEISKRFCILQREPIQIVGAQYLLRALPHRLENARAGRWCDERFPLPRVLEWYLCEKTVSLK